MPDAALKVLKVSIVRFAINTTFGLRRHRRTGQRRLATTATIEFW
jgi:hypothetical protein